MQILKLQRQIENELLSLIAKYELENRLTVATIKEWIWEEEGSPAQAARQFQEKFLGFFSEAKDMDELNNVLQTAMGAWNYFPHKTLNGKSPAEITGGK